MNKNQVTQKFKELREELSNKTREKVEDKEMADVMLATIKNTLDKALLSIFPSTGKTKAKSCIIRQHPLTYVFSIENMDIEIKHVHQMKWLAKTLKSIGYKVEDRPHA